MLFSWKIGSKGSNEESFTIRVPINTSPWFKLTITPGDAPLKVGGYLAKIFEEIGYYVLEVYGFASEEEAHEALPTVHAGLVWAALRHGIALPFPGQTAPVSYEETPELVESDLTRQFLDKGWDRLDGHYPGDRTVIKPEHKRLYADYLGGLRAIAGIRDEEIAGTLSEGLGFPHPAKATEDEKLRLAYNLYSSSFFQFDDSARFLTLVTVLESLNSNRPASQRVLDALESIEGQIEELRNACDEDSAGSGRDDYHSLLRRLQPLRKESIRQGVRFSVADKLRSDPEVSDPEAVGREARNIYDLRSSFVHTGFIDEEKARAAIQRLMDIVPRVLRIMFAEAAG